MAEKWGKNIDGPGYSKHILPLIAQHLMPGMILMQDNASPHTCPHTECELARLGLNPMEWPANSSDLNPIETIWFKMKQRIKAYEKRLTRIRELRDALAAEWEKITTEEILALVDSMPARVKAVVEANGGHTKY
jgi:transposase